MKTSTLTIIIGLFFLLCLSCEKPPPREDCPGGDCPDRPCRDCPHPRSITGEGDIISQTFTVSPFHSIGNTGIANVYITKGDNYEVTLSAQPNIIDYITYEVQGGEIFLGMEENVTIVSSKGIFIDITTPEIQQVTSTGTSFIRLSGSRQGKLRLYNTGTGS
ncbi:MAG: DUF2807 domain-containing protein, partial [Bacteroidales bacterium]